MDLVFVALVLVLATLLVLVYRVNRVRRTDDLDELYSSILRRTPTATAFSLGRSVTDPTKYDNVVLTKDDRLVIQRNDKYPLNTSAEIIPTTDSARGQLVVPDGAAGDSALYEGFEITGMGGRFECPEGYVGPTCTLKPLCPDPPHVDHLRLIDHEHFGALGLYGPADGTTTQISSRRDAKYHARMRVWCRSDGTHQLQVCPSNQILDLSSIQCTPYDVCVDKPQDFKHRFAVRAGDPNLAADEYYMCDSRRSVLKRCGKDLVFSVERLTCISPNECVGLGNETLPSPLNEHSYVQCDHDAARLVQCDPKLGINRTDPKHMRCHMDLDTNAPLECTPQVYHRTTAAGVTYDSGALLCDKSGKFEGVVSCIGDSTRVSHHEWGQRFDISIDAFPTSIFSESRRSCVPTEVDDNIRGLALSRQMVRWSPAMRDEHLYDLVERRFVCDGENSYRWDYEANVSVPPHDPTTHFLDTGRPCQASLVPLERSPWALAPVVKYPLHGKYPPMLVAEELDVRLALQSWPIAIIDESSSARVSGPKSRALGANSALRIRGSSFQVLTWDFAAKKLYRDTYASHSKNDDTNAPMPLGFTAPVLQATSEHAKSRLRSGGGITSNAVTLRLELIGLADRVPDLVQDQHTTSTHLWYTIASGRFDKIRFAEDDAVNEQYRSEREQIPVQRVIDLSVNADYYIAPQFVTKPRTIGRRIEITSRGITVDGAFDGKRLHAFTVKQFLGIVQPPVISVVIDGRGISGIVVPQQEQVFELW